ncbi:vomeronasal type-2 receptor 26-like [Heteronotia binoei]|uniref:vomeronasal type-2 receptor 26-like n=1 Tax=Heteronotia binoei TaxID=13085 RepID=UPI0029307B38|nr:vomeronasal type-2 receptor 26-like [Heteronotia binoei]
MKDPLGVPHEWYQPGDFHIGGVISQIYYDVHTPAFNEFPQKLFDVPHMMTKFYQHVLALAFAVKEINENPEILPNITLGFHMYDSYYSDQMTYRTTLDLLYKFHRYFPNYRCDSQKNVIAIIGGLGADISFHIADISVLYKIPQLTYGSFAPEERDAGRSPSFYRMVPNEAYQHMGIIWLLQHFRWTWVGLYVVNDESGEHFLQTLEPLLSQNRICLAFTETVPNQAHWNDMHYINVVASLMFQPFQDRRANVYILYGESKTLVGLMTLLHIGDGAYMENATLRKVWIMTAQVDFALTGLTKAQDFQFFHGSLSFMIHSKELLGFQTFLEDIKPDWKEGDGFFPDFWEQAFYCSVPNPQEPMDAFAVCTGAERLESLPGPLFEMHMTGHSYSIYNAVYAIAHALHAMSAFRFGHRAMADSQRFELHNFQPWQLHPFLQGISFNNSAGETVSFNVNWEVGTGFDIINLVTFPNTSFARVVPVSVCNDYCQPGYQKKKKEGEKFCCYDCVHCPEGKITDGIDMVDCIRCSEEQYPSKDQDGCIPKVITFLSFDEPLGISLASVAVSFSLVTVLVLGTFMKHKNTPIVKANNRDITYTLLVSLLICFLSSLLFLGYPKKVTCFFRQSAFGIIFSVAISCVLAKTITVIVAFMVTKPGFSMRKWMGKRLSISIILTCSLMQSGLCVVWLGSSPPFPHFDTQSLTTEIVAECNEGSVFMFYIVLGYMGLLSLISLTVAFLARKLPDTFNEAKFITFSMLVFCSVWLSFVPTYLSSKGKHMVAVEIFSILSSSAGLLACIFFPKCYIIVLKPELNKREQLKRYQAGDLVIGGITSQIVYSLHEPFFKKHPLHYLAEVPMIVTKFYQHLLALVFAIQEINENPKILPNVTLGFHIYDSYNEFKMTYRTTVDLLFHYHRFFPNYKCDIQKNTIAVIGGLSADVSFRISDILGLYKIPQIRNKLAKRYRDEPKRLNTARETGHPNPIVRARSMWTYLKTKTPGTHNPGMHEQEANAA